MRILIISKEAWRDEQNGGNVLTNLFSHFPNSQFAQIYCCEQLPNNKICKLYYQITDRMMLNNILYKTKVGQTYIYDEPPVNTVAVEESFQNILKRFGEFKRAARELVWWLGKWDSREILEFARDFNPDIIYAPCYGNHYMQKLGVMIHKALNIPVISFIWDDFYTHKQIKVSPLFWINHFMLRYRTRQTFKHYSLCYTMTDEQREQCEQDFGAKMKILRKSGEFNEKYLKQTVNEPIRIVYAGGVYLNRWKTLAAIVKTMRSINKDRVKMVLDIYTNNKLDKRMAQALNDGVTSRVHSAVTMDELTKIYHRSDIALHVESFDITNRLVVRMSFSTKIVDCLDSGCAVMAVCDREQAGGAYLRRNNCAICIHDLTELDKTLRSIVENPDKLIDMQRRAFDVGVRYHKQENITNMIRNDFQSLANNNM